MNSPDDGGPVYPQPRDIGSLAFNGMSLRCRLAMQFAAAWLPIVERALHHPDLSYERANILGLAMADDLLRRMREGS